MSVAPATGGWGRMSERNTSLIFTKIEIKERCLKQIRRRASRANVNSKKGKGEFLRKKNKSKFNFVIKGKQSNLLR